jgi:UDP-glucose 4-epimerase
MIVHPQVLVITGSSGFIGQRLANSASALGFKVIGIDVKVDIKNKWENHEVDISKNDFSHLIPKDSVIVHLASISTDSACRNDPKLAIDVNYTGTLNTINCANKAGAKHFIFASSEWVYPEKTVSTEQNENDALSLEDLNSFYAITKLVGESLVRTESKTPFTNLRFGIVYGPRLTPGSSLEALALKVYNDESITIGSELTARRFIYVDDLIEGILKCAKLNTDKIPNKAVNLTGNEVISLGSVIVTVNKLLGKTNHFSIESKSPSIRNPVNVYAKALFQWDPNTSLETGIEYCLDAMKKNRKE